MPKANHGPEPKAAPPSLVVLIQQILDHPFAPDLWLKVSDAKERAEVLEERLIDLHDAVEKAIGFLNERDGQFKYDGKGEHLVDEALATLNRVL